MVVRRVLPRQGEGLRAELDVSRSPWEVFLGTMVVHGTVRGREWPVYSGQMLVVRVQMAAGNAAHVHL